jgi:acetyl-CoA acetyltransferase
MQSKPPWPGAWRIWIWRRTCSRAAAGATAWATANSTTACCVMASTTRSRMRASGWHTEDLVREFQVGRDAQDRWALRSQQRFAAAQAAGRFEDEIVTVEIAGRKGPTLFAKDEHNRPGTTLDALAGLKPAFRPDGTITAGNAPSM